MEQPNQLVDSSFSLHFPTLNPAFFANQVARWLRELPKDHCFSVVQVQTRSQSHEISSKL